jgi:hypothetical protein
VRICCICRPAGAVGTYSPRGRGQWPFNIPWPMCSLWWGENWPMWSSRHRPTQIGDWDVPLVGFIARPRTGELNTFLLNTNHLRSAQVPYVKGQVSVSFLEIFFTSPRRARLGGVTRGVRSNGTPPPVPAAGAPPVGPWQEPASTPTKPKPHRRQKTYLGSPCTPAIDCWEKAPRCHDIITTTPTHPRYLMAGLGNNPVQVFAT